MKKLIINGYECRRVKGFENYVVSLDGRFYRTEPFFKREIEALKKNPGLKYLHEKKLQKIFPKRGNPHLMVTFYRGEGKGNTTAYAASVVLRSFGKYPRGGKRKISYKDGDFTNISLGNLSYSYAKVSSHFKLELKDVKDIRKRLESNETLKSIADNYGVSDMAIYRIKSGENWNNKKIIIPKPENPFFVEDGKIRRLLTYFDFKPVENGVVKKFYIKRNPANATDNKIIGIVNGYKFMNTHKNITRARDIKNRLNEYFFK